MTRTAHLALLDTLADWEIGHLLAELRTGRFTGEPFTVITAGTTRDPITTMGGLRIVPQTEISEVDPAADSDLLILPGAELWGSDAAAPFIAAARRFIDAGVPVAAICGAVFGLAGAGLLDERRHTGADPGYLAASGYAGSDHYVDARAVADGGVVTAGPGSPVQFARATLRHLDLMSEEIAEAYEAVFGREDASAYPTLMSAAA